MNFSRLLIVLFALAAFVGGTGAASAMPVDESYSVPVLATDPRDDWVVLYGQAEGQAYAAKCRGSDLEMLDMNVAGWVYSWFVIDADMCDEDAPPANLSPAPYRDPNDTWIIMFDNEGNALPARCYGVDLSFIDDSSGESRRSRYYNVPLCGYEPLGA